MRLILANGEQTNVGTINRPFWLRSFYITGGLDAASGQWFVTTLPLRATR
jgi:hypothetical protein